MLPKKAILLIFSSLTFFIIPPLSATLIRALDLISLTNQADIIAIGEVTSVTGLGPTTLDLGGGPLEATQFAAAVRIDQVLKGAPQPEIQTVDFLLPKNPIGVQAVTSSQYGLFFLTEGQRLRFTDPMHPALPATRAAKLPPAPVLGQVTAVLGQALESPETSDSDRLKALYALGGLQTDLARDTLRHAMSSPSRTIRLDVARTLVARNDRSGLPVVEDALLNPSGLSDTMIANLAGSLGGLKDPLAVPSLKRLVGTNRQDVIKGAAIALRQSGSSDALAPLSRLLDNSDERVRYYAVVGMGEITNQDEWTPAFDEFRSRPAYYIGYWRQWASANISSQ